MSLVLLQQLQEDHAFNPSPVRHNLGVYHVPFDELMPAKLHEKFLRSSATRSERTVVVGVSGSGKSSLIGHTLGPVVPNLAPIFVPVSSEPDEVIATVQSAARLIIQVLVDNVQLAERERSRALEGSTPKRLITKWDIDASFGLSWMVPTVRANIKRQTSPELLINRTAEETLAVVEQLLVTIQKDGTTPILIFDDTDRWFQSHDTEHGRQEMASHFFGKVLPNLCQLSAGIIVAVHSDYAADKQTKEYLQRSIENYLEVPILSSAAALGKIIRSRVISHLSPEKPSEAPPLTDFLETSALSRLYELHQERFKGSLRDVIRVVHTAVAHACDNRYEKLTPELIDLAADAW